MSEKVIMIYLNDFEKESDAIHVCDYLENEIRKTSKEKIGAVKFE